MELARSIHPLLITRGPPGTHDVKKLSQVIESLRSGFPARSPVFDKVLDDRVKQDRLIEPAPVLVCEGWFLGAVPQSIYALDQPVNEFERIKDKDGIWRSWVNDQIVLYKEIFFSDVLIFLRAPSFGASITWRRAQEAENEEVSETKRRRNSFDVEEFLKHFERLMLWINEDLPTRSQIQIIFDENHNIEKIIDASRNE
ncbi:MAG: kinase [Gammaproteobacteria bacterium]|nr:kinase [Gammaproteobacteria bacterium]|tara:strand:- start:417 stop:1013 length:597 start_codon:yes stop_codon:yes gene_type:complete